jgi:hypothetical protein
MANRKDRVVAMTSESTAAEQACSAIMHLQSKRARAQSNNLIQPRS